VLSFVLASCSCSYFLADAHESLTCRSRIILIVAMCLLAAMLGVNLNGTDNKSYNQISRMVVPDPALRGERTPSSSSSSRGGGEQMGMKPADAAEPTRPHLHRARSGPVT